MNTVKDTQSWYTYVLQSKKDNKLYTGMTKDLQKRFKQHNNKLIRSTKGRTLFELMYHKMCLSKDDVRAKKLYLKSGMGKRYLYNYLKSFLSLTV